MKIKLIKTEGNWLQTSLGCYISVNNNLVDVITPLNSPHEIDSIEIPNKGIMKIVIRDMGKSDGFLASLTIPIALLIPTSGVWLPLTTNSNIDTIFQIIDEVQMPRIMISVDNDYNDDELFLTNQEFQPDSLSEIVLASEILISKEPENSLLKTSNFNFDKETIDKKQEIIDALTSEIEDYKEKVLKEKETSENLRQKVLSLLNTLKSNSDRAIERENSLLELITEKEGEISKSLEINRNLQNTIRKIEYDKKNLAEKLERLDYQLERFEELKKEHSLCKEFLKNSELNVEKLTNSFIELTKLSLVKENRTETDEKAENMVTEERSVLNTTVIENNYSSENVLENNIYRVTEEKLRENDEIKEIISKAIEKFIKIEEIVKIRDFFYKVNDIELPLALTEDGIFVKMGLSLCSIQNYCIEKKKINGKTFDSHLIKNEFCKILENDYKKKSPQKKSILKPVSNLQKYKTILNKSPSKEFRINDNRKVNK